MSKISLHTQFSLVFARSFSLLCSCSPCPPARPNSLTIRLVRSSWSAPTIGVIASTYLCKDCDRSGTGRRGRLSWSWRMQPTAPRWSGVMTSRSATARIGGLTRCQVWKKQFCKAALRFTSVGPTQYCCVCKLPFCSFGQLKLHVSAAERQPAAKLAVRK